LPFVYKSAKSQRTKLFELQPDICLQSLVPTSEIPTRKLSITKRTKLKKKPAKSVYSINVRNDIILLHLSPLFAVVTYFLVDIFFIVLLTFVR
jgi:hypothetical protein